MTTIITPKLFAFLRKLRRNNNREWFADNKGIYQRDVQTPAVELVEQLIKPLGRVAPMLGPQAKANGGSVMRIYRDTRFSKDKTPYKTNVGISIRHQAAGDIHAPGAYIHLDPDECFIGAGCWRPERSILRAIRESIAEDPKTWVKIRDQKRFRERFDLAGEKLKTFPRDFPKDHPQIDDLRRIDFIAVAPLTVEEITSADLIDKVVDDFKRVKGWMRFLCEAIDIPY